MLNMNIRACLTTLVLGSLATALTMPTALAAPPTDAKTDNLLVVGEQPGPGLWKVEKNGNTLWIVGTYSPLPQKMKWRARELRERIGSAQEVISPPTVTVGLQQIGVFRALSMIPSAFEARKNPDGATLKDLIPDDVYQRWLTLRDKYIEENNTTDESMDIERWRPMFAALELYDKAINRNGMTQQSPVWSTIEQTAKQLKVKLTEVKFEPKIDNPRGALRELNRTRLADIDCFTKTIARLETDLADMKRRANAWASGDVALLKSQAADDQRAACARAVRDAAFVKTLGLTSIADDMEAAWLAAAERALTQNSSTVASLSVDTLLSPTGPLAKLKAKGYTVTEPE
jgi:hypothetical protein